MLKQTAFSNAGMAQKMTDDWQRSGASADRRNNVFGAMFTNPVVVLH